MNMLSSKLGFNWAELGAKGATKEVAHSGHCAVNIWSFELGAVAPPSGLFGKGLDPCSRGKFSCMGRQVKHSEWAQWHIVTPSDNHTAFLYDGISSEANYSCQQACGSETCCKWQLDSHKVTGCSVKLTHQALTWLLPLTFLQFSLPRCSK